MSVALVLLVIATVALIVHLLWHAFLDRPAGFPPGLPRLPLFGGYPLLLAANYRHMHRACARVARWYGTDVMGFYYRQVPVITVHTLRHTREVLLNPLLDGRAVFELVRTRDPLHEVHGIFFTAGAAWKEQRRFALRHLRDFGFGRRFAQLEQAAGEELDELVERLRVGGAGGGVLELPVGLTTIGASLLLQCVRGRRSERAEMAPLLAVCAESIVFQRTSCIFGRMFSLLPWWRYVFPDGCGYRRIRTSALALHEFVRRVVEEEFGTFERGQEERHFLDRYFERLAAEEGAEESTFSISELTGVVVDLFLPSMVAISTGLSLTFKRLLLQPEHLHRMQCDIDALCGRRPPTLDDRQHLPYVEAVLRESLRLDTLVPSNLSHQAIETTTIGGYVVPKGALVVTILEDAHREESEFADALSFRPERLLDSQSGQLKVALDQSLPFGAGKRLCAGETFARNTMFLVLATLVQNFDIRLPVGDSFVHPDQDAVASGFTKTVPDFRLEFTPRTL